MKDEIIYKGKSTVDGSIVYGEYRKVGSYNYIVPAGVAKVPVHPYSISIVGMDKELHVIYSDDRWTVLNYLPNIALARFVHREEAYYFAKMQEDIDKVYVHKKNGTIRFVTRKVN